MCSPHMQGWSRDCKICYEKRSTDWRLTLDLSNEQITALVSKGGPRACRVLAELLKSGKSYPGPVEDILSMTNDYSSMAFAYPVDSIAWAYLEAHKLVRYDGDNPLIMELIAASIDGSFCGRAYE